MARGVPRKCGVWGLGKGQADGERDNLSCQAASGSPWPGPGACGPHLDLDVGPQFKFVCPSFPTWDLLMYL